MAVATQVELAENRAQLGRYTNDFEPGLRGPSDAEAVVRGAATIENVATLRALAAVRTAHSGA